MVTNGKILWFLALCSATLFAVLECRDVECFKCSWTGSHELDEEKIKALDEVRKEMETKSVPINNPLTSPYVISKVVPDRNILQGKCDKCKLSDGKCVRWTFHLNDVIQNATYMCVQSVSENELGIFDQQMPGGVLKKVVICNTDYCNISSSGRARPSVFLYFLFAVLFVLRSR